ncbi:hypothetical protein ACWDV4_22120 [Micromonospora sp. NPDC003197]
MQLSFDPDDPPAEPPPDCLLPTIWRMSYALYQAHQLAEGDLCRCGTRYPCAGRRAMRRGLLEACGLAVRSPRTDLLDAWRGSG